jgi:PiT family inorganic phosphate transporter
MTTFLAIVFVTFLAYANGANDNFKGVATLFGSRTVGYRPALLWATVTTGLGSVTALLLAKKLIVAFSGKGFVPDEVVGMQSFALAVGLGAAITVMLATRLGFPISTTHALTGALVGAGLIASGSGVNFSLLGTKILLPLAISPPLAILGAATLYPVLGRMRRGLGIGRETCVCVGTQVVQSVPPGTSCDQAVALAVRSGLSIAMADEAVCLEKYHGSFFGFNARSILDRLHFISAGAVSFARGLNDTPKMAGIMLIGGLVSPWVAVLGVGIAIAAGGLLSAKKVAETMSHRITTMNGGQGFTANLMTSFLVIVASRLGMPVSTTHVSCGSLFGIGATTGQARWNTIFQILLAWLITLPVAAVLSALAFVVLEKL